MTGEHDSMLLCGHVWRLWTARVHQGTNSKPFTRFSHVIKEICIFVEVKKKGSIIILCVLAKLLHHVALFLCTLLCLYSAPGLLSQSTREERSKKMFRLLSQNLTRNYIIVLLNN